MNTGFFTIEDTHEVLKCANLPTAKQFASGRVTAFQQKAKPQNIEKALKMINNSKSINALAIYMANFMLAHPSENQKVI